jgi:hypothetical protein
MNDQPQLGSYELVAGDGADAIRAVAETDPDQPVPYTLTPQAEALFGAAQGRTVEASHVLVTETLSRQSFYVGMSRGRTEAGREPEAGS